MIIMGLSHIALNTDDIERSTSRLACLGYGIRFDEPDLENHAAKAALLTRFQHRHHIRGLHSGDGMAVELLDHGQMDGPQSADLIPIFQSAAPLAEWTALTADSLPITAGAWSSLEALLDSPRVYHDPVLKLTFVWFRTAKAPALFSCIMPTGDLESTEKLLLALRFRSTTTSGLWSLMTPIPALQAHLIPVPSRDHVSWKMRAPLDSPGCPCLALMVRGGKTLTLPPALQGYVESFTLTVNTKSCRITLVRPQHGPVIELVEQSA